MKLKKLTNLFLSIASLTSVSFMTVSCGNSNSLYTGEIPNEVILEKRIWQKTKSDMIDVDDENNKWVYSSDSFIEANDGTIQMKKDGDYIITEKFNTNLPFSVDVTMSLNGGNSISTNVEKDEFIFEVQALNSNMEVVDSQRLDELDEFPDEKKLEVKTFNLNPYGKQVSYVKFVLVKVFYKNYRTNRVGIGRVKIYTGESTKTTLPDGVEDNYVSEVTYTNYNSDIDPNIRTSRGISLQDVRTTYYDLGTNGNQKVLVIPVKFQDTTEDIFDVYAGYKIGGFDGMRKIIEQAYFGADGESGYESLSSYYYKSSYNRLNISGKVTPWYTYDGTVQEFYNVGKGESSVYDLVDKATMWYKTNFDDYAEFDTNNDGYFDCVEFVYAQPNCSSSSTGVCNKSKNTNAKDLFWAFCWKRSGQEPVENWPKPYTFVWLSFDFLLNNKNAAYTVTTNNTKTFKADAHTVIHETGHALGLLDYYSTGYDGSTPAAGIDMMDHNVGDHNAYSKWLFNWTEPKEQIVYDELDESTKEYTVTLRPFVESGDFVIIPAYNASSLPYVNKYENDEVRSNNDKAGKLDSPLNEYITIEYFTNDGVNYQDSLEPYENYSVSVMTEPGLKMFHVDSRLAHLSYNNSASDYSFDSYIEANADKNNYSFSSTSSTTVIDLAHHNDAKEQNYDTGTSDDKDYRMISSILARENLEKNLFGSPGHTLENADLFGSKSSGVNDFGVTNHQNFVFNNGYSNVYSFTIESMSKDSITLKFTYKA